MVMTVEASHNSRWHCGRLQWHCNKLAPIAVCIFLKYLVGGRLDEPFIHIFVYLLEL